jgi:hypothetical protein
LLERIYLFFFGGRKGKRLQRFMEQNLENMLQAALSDYVKFRIEVTNPMVIWLPFAGHKRPPHITSQVTRLQFGVMSVSSCDPHDRAHPEDFECGLFVQSGTEFPSTTADFSQHGTERPFASQKFKIVAKDMSIHIDTSP